MKNKTTLFFFSISFLLIANSLNGHSSSSYLISNIAFKTHDFKNVFHEFEFETDHLNLKDFEHKLISLINLNKLSLARDLSIKILKNDPNNQEALIVNLVYFIIHNQNNKFYNFYKKYKNNLNRFTNYLFFENNELKNNNEISTSFISVVRNLYSSFDSSREVDYNYLFFYSSMSLLLNPINDEALFIKGKLYHLIYDYEKAEFFYNQIAPNSFYLLDAQRNTAFIYSEKFEFKKAEQKIINLIEESSNQPDLIKILADYYRTKKFYEFAIKNYTKLILNQNLDVWNLFYLRGICYERLGKWDLAEKDFLHSLKLKPDSPNVLNYLAYGWIEKNINLDTSLMMLKEAYQSNPDSHYILDSLAWAHYKKNNLKLAAELMEKVIDMVPGEAISLDHLGDIYFALNRKREAVFLWKQAKDLAEPEDDITNNIIQKLEHYYGE